ESGGRWELDEVPSEAAGTLHGHLCQPLWGPLVTIAMSPGPGRGPVHVAAGKSGFYAGTGVHARSLSPTAGPGSPPVAGLSPNSGSAADPADELIDPRAVQPAHDALFVEDQQWRDLAVDVFPLPPSCRVAVVDLPHLVADTQRLQVVLHHSRVRVAGPTVHDPVHLHSPLLI